MTQRPFAVLGFVVAVAVAALFTAAPAVGQAGAGLTVQACAFGYPDFNGDSCADLVVADPDATVSGQLKAGRINLRYGAESGPGTWTALTQGQPGVEGVPEAGDGFGAMVRVARADNDYLADLVVATPAEDVGSATDAGIIQVIFGSPQGLGAGRPGLTVRQGLHGVPGTPEAGDRFGAGLTVNATGADSWLPAIGYGVPGEDIGSVPNAGTAGLVAFDAATGDVVAAGAVSQNSSGIDGSAEAGDRFGAAVEMFQGPGELDCAADGLRGYTLVVGVPGEDLGGVRDAGLVHLVQNLSSDTTLSQDSPGVSGVAEPGDQFGGVLATASQCEHDGPSHVTLGIGVPNEDVGAKADAGAAYLFQRDGELPLAQMWSASQDTAEVEGTAEPGDRFGAVIALDGPWLNDAMGRPAAVSAPGEDLGVTTDAGAVQVFGDRTTTPGAGDIFVDQATVGELPETGDHFGAAILTRPDYLFVAAPDDATYQSGVAHGVSWPTLFGGTPEPSLRFVPGVDGVPTGASRFGAGLS